MTCWVYRKTEPQLWTVGFYEPEGNWNAESDHSKPGDAAERVNYLNGGNASIQNSLSRAIHLLKGSVQACKMNPNYRKIAHDIDEFLDFDK